AKMNGFVHLDVKYGDGSLDKHRAINLPFNKAFTVALAEIGSNWRKSIVLGIWKGEENDEVVAQISLYQTFATKRSGVRKPKLYACRSIQWLRRDSSGVGG
ncbi:MAG: hypothetical protein AABO57_10395, partial [Acidobacteriota bacterium]